VLAELGDIEEAISIAEKALDRVRTTTDTSKSDFRNLSEEGWLIGLLQALAMAQDPSQPTTRSDLRVRSRDLRRYHCDPNEDLQLRGEPVRKVPSSASKKKTPGFHPGTFTETSQFFISSDGEWVLMQMFHDGAWPLRCGNVRMSGAFPGLTRWLLTSHTHLAIAIALRTDRGDALEKALDRPLIANLDSATIQSLYNWLSRRLREAIASWIPNNRSPPKVQGLRDRIINNCPLVLSRLSFRLTKDQLEDVFTLSLEMYLSDIYKKQLRLHSRVKDMFRTILYAASEEQLFGWMPRLLTLPIPDGDHFSVPDRGQWPEPFDYIPPDVSRRATAAERASWAEAVQRLIQLAADGIPPVQEAATSRLIRLHLLDAIAEQQKARFAAALWRRGNPIEVLLSMGWHYPVILALPERTPGENADALTKYIKKTDVPSIEAASPGGGISSTSLDRVIRHLESLDRSIITPWHSAEEKTRRLICTGELASTLLNKLIKWWQASSVRLLQLRNSFHVEIQFISEFLCLAFSNVIAPNLPENDSPGAMQTLVAEMEQGGLRTLLAIPAMLKLGGTTEASAASRIRKALHGSTSDDVSEGSDALFLWLAWGSQPENIQGPPSHLLAPNAQAARSGIAWKFPLPSGGRVQ